MQIIIIETREEKELNIYDPKSGVNWTGDLIGSVGNSPEYNEEADRYLMSQDTFLWWDDLINRYQVADDKYNEILDSLNGNEAEKLTEEVQNLSCDLEDFPYFLSEICKQYSI